jgi:NAD-dependent SIR2 family protein deacetylase
MTRCVACNKNLNDYESTRKDIHGVYLDMCNGCYKTIKNDVVTVEREDLSTTEEVEPELDFSESTDD